MVARAEALAPRVVPLLVALAGYGAVLVLAARGRGPGERAVLRASVVLLVLAVAAPPLHSHDVYVYGMQGRIVAVHRSSPYVHEAGEFDEDAFLEHVPSPYLDGFSSYGPAFTLVEAQGAVLAAGSRTVTRLWFQGVAAAAVLAVLLLLRHLGHGAGALAFVGLNPVLLGKGVNEGHVDVLVGALVLVAVVLAGHRRVLLAGAAMAVACLCKLLALVGLVGLAAWVLAHRGWRAAAGTTAVGLGTVAAGYLAAGGRAAIEPLRATAAFQSRASIWAQPRLRLTTDLIEEGLTGTDAGTMARGMVARAALVTVVVTVALVVLALRRRPGPAPAVGGAFVAYLLAGVYAPAWYVAAALPALALVWRSRLAVLAAGHGALLAFAYVYSAHLADDPLGAPLRALFTWAIPAFEVAAVVGLVAWSAATLITTRGPGTRRRELHPG